MSPGGEVISGYRGAQGEVVFGVRTEVAVTGRGLLSFKVIVEVQEWVLWKADVGLRICR